MTSPQWRDEVKGFSRSVLESIEKDAGGEERMEEHFDPDDYYDLVLDLVVLLDKRIEIPYEIKDTIYEVFGLALDNIPLHSPDHQRVISVVSWLDDMPDEED